MQRRYSQRRRDDSPSEVRRRLLPRSLRRHPFMVQRQGVLLALGQRQVLRLRRH